MKNRTLANRIISLLCALAVLLSSAPGLAESLESAEQTPSSGGSAVFGVAVTSNKDVAFNYEDEGDYAVVSITGTHRKNNKPTVQHLGARSSLVEAWTINNLKNNASLSLTATVTALPDDGTALAAYAMKGTELGDKLRDNLAIGDEITVDLAFKGTTGIGFVKGDEPVLTDGAVIWANDDVYLTGKMPGNAVVEATPVLLGAQTAQPLNVNTGKNINKAPAKAQSAATAFEIDGRDVLAAYDIKIYANANQQEKGKTWQPAGDKVQVHFFDNAFADAKSLSIYHMETEDDEPVLVEDGLTSDDGWVSFEAESFSVYVVAGVIEKDIEIEGSTYRVSVAYDSEAGIPDGAELAVREVSAEDYLDRAAEALGLSEDDEVGYHKFLDIAIVKDGEEIEPKTPVEVTVRLLDVEGETAESLQVVHFGESGVEALNCTADEDGNVTFTTDSFSTFGFESILSNLLQWADDAVKFTLKGFSSLLGITYKKESIVVEQLERGLEIVSAYHVTSSRLLSGLRNLKLNINLLLDLGKGETVQVYAVSDGKAVGEPVEETDETALSISLDGMDSFAIVRDTGYREKHFDLDDVVLDGFVPKAAEATATDASNAPAVEALAGENSTTLAAYDITIMNGSEAFQPDEEHTVEVSIAVPETVEDASTLTVWHIADDGNAEKVEGFELVDGRVVFEAVGFSIYAVVETTLTKTVDASDGNTYEINVTYKNSSGIPMEGTELLVAELLPGDEKYDEYLAASAAKVGTKAENIELSRVFDIQIVDENDNSHVYEPVGDVEVSIRLVGETLGDYANLDVLHFVEDENTEGFTVYDMDSIVDGETVQFTTDSFSVYAVIGTTYLRTYRFFTFNEFGEYVEYALYTDSGKTTFTQTIKNGEKPVAPQNPTNPQDPNATFAGWFEDIREAGASVPVFAASPYDFDNIPEITQNEEVHLYAKFSSYAYVIFYDQYDADSGTFPVAYTVRQELTNGSASINIADYSINYHGSGNGMVFTGWSEVPITTPGAANNDLDEAVERLSDTITVTGNKELYPIFTPVYWITFYSGPTGSGATYYPDSYYFDGEGVSSLADHIPTRDAGSSGAYTFDGWYADAVLDANHETTTSSPAVKIANEDGSLIASASATGVAVNSAGNSMALTDNITLFAGWTTTGMAEYSVIIWKQKASDASGLANADKTYDFLERATTTGTIGDTVTVSDDFINRSYSGFTYSRCDDPTTIASDGSTVLNVYYDRNDLSTVPTGYYALTFADSVTGMNESVSLPISYNQDSGEFAKISYGTNLSSLVPDAPISGRAGYSFTNWYADQTCTIRVFFDSDSYETFTGTSKVLYAAMPDYDLTLYAGWEEEWYIVTIDPNYGAMYAPENGAGSGSTWFWSAYGGKIQEYTTVTRDYVESASGTWYYVNHDSSATYPDRHTYYTQDPSKATEFTTFAYEPGVYRYEGWYEVKSDGTEEVYDFSRIVDHTITLKLHWTKVGAFYLVYDPGVGTLNDNEDQETFYVELEGDTYADNADVVITRIATPPDGYEFAGWTIRGDDSGTIYYPGRSFTLLTKYAATVQGKKTVYLDAVYTKVATASIVYDANGGTITESELDYGRPYDSTAPTPVYSCDTSTGTATISNLVNNSRVYLSDGSGFSRTDATFVGWSNKSVYDPDDVDAIFYLPGVQTTETYNVDTSEPFTLYAVWQVSIKYHLNNGEDTNATFGGDWGIRYALTGDTYTQNAYLNNAVSKPSTDPATTNSGRVFRYWATKDDSDNYTMYDFSQPVKGALDLYACWDMPLTVTIHAADASTETITEKTSSDADWAVTTSLSVSAPSTAPIDLSTSDPTGSVTAPSGYVYAFAAVLSNTGNLQDITETYAVDSIFYDSADGKIHAKYRNGTEAALTANEEIYFLYYQKEKLNIKYATMADNGVLTLVTPASAPTDTVNDLGQYDMASGITAPLTWLNDSTYTYYAFAIGSASAGNAKDLTLITNTSDTDSTRPALLVKNTWCGFQYSTDGGMAWTSCGYEPTLYVVYFAKRATVVTFTENTVGLAADMGTPFSFNYVIESTSDSGSTWATVYDYHSANSSYVILRNGEAYSTILFADSAGSYQRITITQETESGFTTTVTSGEASATNPFAYTVDGTGTAQAVTFTNTRTTAATVEVHVALVDVANGSISKDDTQRSATSSHYTYNLPLDSQTTFEAALPSAALFTGDSTTYAFGTVLYGSDSGGEVTVGSMGVVSIACEPVDAGDANVYGVYLKDSAGNRLAELGSNTIYYLYYPMPVIRYMEETDAGALTVIQGSTDGTTVSDTITYNEAPLTLNGKTVAQNQKLEIPPSGLVISQSVGTAYFNMPPLLDKGTDKLYLVYSRIGAGAPDQTNVSGISVSDGLTLYLQIRDNKLEWSFDGSAWTAFATTPTIYAIYQERGYTLEITKTVPIDTGYTEPFTVTLSSTAINRASYAVEGTGNSTVSATPAVGSTSGTITVQVTDGSVIRIHGLGSGKYTVTESGNENHVLTASETYIEAGSSETNDLTVTNNAVSINLDREKTLALTNTAKVICKVGTRYFNTIQSAVQWIEDNSATFSGTIEMLVDYLMPASDAPVIPYYLNVTLTTASEYDGGTAAITRSGNFASGAMFTNSGTLTFGNITLDGNGSKVTAASTVIDNEGTLTVGDGATIQNAKNSGNGGVINTWDGAVTVSGGAIRDNEAVSGGVIYASGGSVTVSGGVISGNEAVNGGAIYYTGTGSVTVSGGSVTANTAVSGGAVYLEKGTLTVSGGSMASNIASENGGAVYAANGAIEVSGGTIGGSGTTGNSAKNGGAIYLESGSVTVSGNAAISYNVSSENGGGVYTASGAITVLGSTAISRNSAANGGGLYSASGAISVTGATLSGNQATTGNGGGLYAGSGIVSMNTATLTGNSADTGYGGGVYGNSGAATLTSCTFGGASGSGNSAINGAAVYTNTGSATFSAGTVSYNTATNGGAVGVGSSTARLYFSGNAVVKDNTMSGSASNVYLDQDSDAVINATGLGGSASIGVYVPDQNVTVTDISGATTTGNLFDRRGLPGAFFATYTNNSNVGKFTNDRQSSLSVQQETSSKRLYWGKAFTVEVRYLASFSASSFSTTVADGTGKNVDSKTSITYYAPSDKNAVSEIANDLRSAHTINDLSATAVFAVAFVGDDRTFANYITEVNWGIDSNQWSFVKRDGTEITGDKLVVYFAEPAYIQIENNTEHPLDISALTVLGQSAINNYGYVFAVNGVIQNKLLPITAADLSLEPGKNIKLLFPGGKNAAWTLNGSFTGTAEGENIPYTLNGTANTLTAAAGAASFSLNGTTLNTNGGTYNIVFGGKSAICRIVTTAIDGVQDSEIAGKTDTPDFEGKVEYTFSTLNQAVTFAQTHSLTVATIEMLVDYLIPGSDVITSLPTTCNFTFSTAIGGTYKYSDDSSARATISRDQGNNSSFITSTNGVLENGDYKTTLTVKNLIFDGKNIGGSNIRGGIVKTKGWNVVVDHVEFRNSRAQFGGGIYIESVNNKSSDKTPAGSLTVRNSDFISCESTHSDDKYGGGAVWTSMKNVTIEGSSFTNCEAVHQAGAVFHYVGGNYTTTSTITNCTFEDCQSKAAGSLESGAKTVTIKGCTFRNSKATDRNGGAVNVYALDNANPAVSTGCSVRLEDCTFENCYCRLGSNGNGNGGALRSTAVYNEVINCTFTNATGVQGGAIAISNTNADTAIFTNCKMDSCSASNQGGGIYCTAKTIIIDGTSNSVINCSATNEGGAIYHGRNVNGSSLSISDMMIDNCSSSKSGGGVYSTAQTVSLNGVTVKNCTSSAQGGGLCVIPGSNSSSSRSVTINDSVVQHNTATSNGGGIYTNALTASLTGTTVTGNTATGNGGGVCHNTDSASGRLTVDSCTVSANTSGGKGGGTYTLAQMTIRNDTSITGNHLSTNVATDAAGVYIKNGRTLTVGTAGAATEDASSVTGNLTKNGSPSNLRLSQGNSLTSDNSTNSIDVLCHLSGEFRVIDAYSKGTQFGTTEVSTAESPVYTNGFSDIRHVFIADDDSLYGIIDLSDSSLRKIIWAGDPICKITDANGRLLYVDTIHEYPAIFDKLDASDANSTSSASAFSLLRNAEPELYYADGTLYTGSTYQVKMLVENYTATNRINTSACEGRTIILTTAGSNDSQYPYRGRSGTRSTITRGTGMDKNYSFVTANVNLTLTNIVLDGGSESGVTANSKTSIITSSQSGVTVTLGRNSALQNAAVSGTSNGGAVYLKNASLVIEGGAIRNCSAYNGGAVYKEGTGTVTMIGGSITGCTARNNGGGICIQSGPTAANGNAFIMPGGSITRCTALNGGGVWINNSYSMSMSGGNISQNNATAAGGGIAVGGNKARLNFSGSAFVYSNTLNGNACNVQMNQSFVGTQNNPQNPWTIIHTSGLIRGATIGVYVPDNNSLYNDHGVEAKPFASYEGTPAGFNYFINDRNGLKGGLMEEQVVGIDMKVYWRQIYTLEVNLEVLSKAASDKERDIRFTVTLSGTVGGKQWNEVNKTYGDLDFRGGIATFTLNGSTKTTAMADLLPLGYGYTVTMEAADAAGFTVYPSLAQTGEMNISSQFLYTVSFRLAKDVVCKITDDTYGLLYYKRGEAYVEAVYDALVSAFNRVNMGGLYYKVGDAYIPYTSNEHRIEMLIPEYEMTEAAALNAGKTVYLTTADPNADDGFPYAGGSSTAVIKRGYTGASMITVNGDLAQGNITLDGNGTNYPVSVNGGIVNVNAGGSMTVGTGATLQNSTTSGDGAAVYLAEDSTMKISGAPAFENNVTTGAVFSGSTNGGTSDYYTRTAAKQDIFIAGYNSTDATSLHVTGNITSDQGSIAVWAEQALHFEQSKQFAVMDGGTYTGLNAFRNARTDTDTKNPQKGDPKYLYGVIRGSDGKVYWSGSMDLTITKTLAGDFADMTQTFEFTVSGLTAGDICAYTRYTSTDGTTWTAATGEGATGTLTANASGVLENISLGHHQKIVISIPCGTDVIVSEKNGVYTANHTIGNSSSTAGNTTARITMNNDTTITFINTLKAVAPTGLSFAYAPFLLMAAAGIMLGMIGRSKRREEE